MELEIEALRAFLEDMDVGEYRRKTEELLERGEKVFLVLEITEDGVSIYEWITQRSDISP